MLAAILEEIERAREVVLGDLARAGTSVHAGQNARICRRVDNPFAGRQRFQIAAQAQVAVKETTPAATAEARFISLPGRARLSMPQISTLSMRRRSASASRLPTKPQIPVIRIFKFSLPLFLILQV